MTVEAGDSGEKLTGASPSWKGGDGRPVLLVIVAVVGVLCAFLGLAAWAMSSPSGGSPDDDYHLGSIWCPRPIPDSGCQYTLESGQYATVDVPESVKRSAECMAFHPEIDAACADGLSDNRLVASPRFDDGNYPMGYYQFNHLFVGPNVDRSVLVMRLSNILLGFGTLALVGALAPPKIRYRLVVSVIAAWIPMGVYFVASNNPSSWSLTGNIIYAAALISATETRGMRRYILMALGALGAVLSFTSRSDAAFYLVVITLGIWFLVRITRRQTPVLVFSMVAALAGLFVFISTGHAHHIGDDAGWPNDPNMPLLHVFAHDLYTLPEYFASFWGLNGGPGWFDVPLDGWSTLTMILVAGGLVFVGARHLSLRKFLSAGVILGALGGIPVVYMTLQHVPNTAMYQGRYMLPLLAVFFLIWLTRPDGRIYLGSAGQVTLLVMIASVSNAAALRRLISRYSHGIGAPPGSATWWPWSFVSPTGMWLIGSVAMAVGITILLLVALRAAKLAPSIGSDESRMLSGGL